MNIFLIGSNQDNQIIKDIFESKEYQNNNLMLPDSSFILSEQKCIVDLCDMPKVDLILFTLNLEEQIADQSIIQQLKFYSKLNNKKLVILTEQNQDNPPFKQVPNLLDLNNFDDPIINSLLFQMISINAFRLLDIYSYQQLCFDLTNRQDNNKTQYIDLDKLLESADLKLNDLIKWLETKELIPFKALRDNYNFFLRDRNNLNMNRVVNLTLNNYLIKYLKTIKSITNSPIISFNNYSIE